MLSNAARSTCLCRVIFQADGHDSCSIQTQISAAAARFLPLNSPFLLCDRILTSFIEDFASANCEENTQIPNTRLHNVINKCVSCLSLFIQILFYILFPFRIMTKCVRTVLMIYKNSFGNEVFCFTSY